MEGLSASGLSSKLKAKKRRALSEQLQALATVRIDTQLKISRTEACETEIQEDAGDLPDEEGMSRDSGRIPAGPIAR